MPKYQGGLGFRDTEFFNLAMLAKQAWRLLRNPDSLSAKILRAVYYPDGNVLQSDLGSHPSQVWRAISAGLSVLKQGLIRSVGNGRSINIWDDNWLPRDNLLRALHPRSANPPQLVSDLIDEPSKSWNRQRIVEHLQPPDVPFVVNIPISVRNIEDSWAWHYERSGIFTVRSAYRLLVDTKKRREDWLEGRPAASNTSTIQGQWRKLWKVRVPGTVKQFAWRLALSSIPTEAVRHHRSMADSKICPICNGAEDSWLHALIDCNIAKCVWSLMEDELV